MKPNYYLISFILPTLLIIPGIIFAQQKTIWISNQPKIEHFDAEAGFPALPSATSMGIDEDGYIWFGAWAGLIKYDGYTFKTYAPNNNNFRRVDHAYPDRNGHIWFTGANLYTLNPKTEEIIEIPFDEKDDNGIPKSWIRDIAQDQDGNMWLATSKGLKKISFPEPGNYKKTKFQTFLAKNFPEGFLPYLDSIKAKDYEIHSITQVGDFVDSSIHFFVSEKSPFLCLSVGEANFEGGLVDWGWIENAKGDTIWSMTPQKAFHAGGNTKNLWQKEVISLEKGQYQLRYISDDSHSWKKWNAAPPVHKDLYGIALYSLDDSDKVRLLSIENDYLSKNNFLPGDDIWSLELDTFQNLWLAIGEAGLFKTMIGKEGKLQIQDYTSLIENKMGPRFFYMNIIPAPNNQLWITGMTGPRNPYYLGLFNPHKKRLVTINHDLATYRNYGYTAAWPEVIQNIIKDQSNTYWLGSSQHGLFSFKMPEIPITKKDTISVDVKMDQYHIDIWRGEPHLDVIHEIAVDRNENLWIGTNQSGIYKLKLREDGIRFRALDVRGLNTDFEYIDNFGIDRSDNLYLFSPGPEAHVAKFNFANQEVDYFGNLGKKLWEDPNSGGNLILPTKSSDILWFGYRTKGEVVSFDVNQKQLINRYDLKTNRGVKPIFEDSKGNIWITSSYADVWVIPPGSTEAKHLPIYSDTSYIGRWNGVAQMQEDKKGDLWLSYPGRGLGRLTYLEEQDTFVFKEYLTQERFRTIAIYPDKNDKIWVAISNKGLLLFDSKNEKIEKLYDEQYGLTNKSIAFVGKDRLGRIWTAHSIGFQLFDPKKEIFFTPEAISGISIEYIQNPVKVSPGNEGYFYFTSPNGLYKLDPNLVGIDSILPILHVNAMAVPNRNDPNTRVKVSVDLSQPLVLKHYQNDLEILYSGLHYQNAPKLNYSYFLEGWDDDWVEVGSQRIARFSNLSPGTYRFHLKAANPDGVWVKDPIVYTFTLLPPWWKTTLAYVGYIIALLSLIWFVYRFQLNRQLALAEAQKLKELDQLKTKLYTNITHEFRTPLTVIIGMVKKVREFPQEWFREGLEMIQRNGIRLKQLVNQMLDLAKLDAGSMSVNWKQGDIVPLLSYAVESFHSLAESKGVNLSFFTLQEKILMDHDLDKLLQIVSNLVSNAIKYTESGGQINVTLSRTGQLVSLEVQDNGTGIPKDKLPYIFDRFYQVEDSSTRSGEGTGIGLALTKELVTILGGAINVKSIKGRGSSFIVDLPIRNEAALGDRASSTITDEEKYRIHNGTLTNNEILFPFQHKSQTPTALIIEDNADVATYLSSVLSPAYQISWAKNGQEGIEIAIEQVPDIIICDVMMPVKDGYEVCKVLKKDEVTNHIPIIMLTAKADNPSRLEGLDVGADVYLTKPVDERELLIRINRLIELRSTLQKRYSEITSRLDKESDELPIQDKFLSKVMEQINENIDKEAWDVSELCSTVHLSRSQVHRKIKSLTGLSITLFIRKVKMQKAKELLETGGCNVSETAYAIGYKNPNHFSTHFKEHFNVPPSSFLP